MKITERQFKNAVNKKIDQVVINNRFLLNLGNKTKYNENCNFLKGIDFVMNLWKKTKRGKNDID